MQTKEARVTHAKTSAKDCSALSSWPRYSVPSPECHQCYLLIAIVVTGNAFGAVLERVFVLMMSYLTAFVGRSFVGYSM